MLEPIRIAKCNTICEKKNISGLETAAQETEESAHHNKRHSYLTTDALWECVLATKS